MELQHNLSFPLFIKKSCILEKHICSEWGISAIHQRLAEPSPCGLPPKRRLDCSFRPYSSFSWLLVVWRLLRAGEHGTGKQGRTWGQFLSPSTWLCPRDSAHWLPCRAAQPAPPVQAEGEVHPYSLQEGSPEGDKHQRSWMLLQRIMAGPCCCQRGCHSKGRCSAERGMNFLLSPHNTGNSKLVQCPTHPWRRVTSRLFLYSQHAAPYLTQNWGSLHVCGGGRTQRAEHML